jgi:hypothetical protein
MAMTLLLGAGCGDGGGSAVDASPGADASLTAPDAGPSGERFLISSFTIAGSVEDAFGLGLDIDGDTFVENEMGIVMGDIAATVDIDPGLVFAEGLARGDIIQLLALAVDVEGQGTLRGLVGRDRDTDPSDNLSGREPFVVDDSAPTDTPLPVEAGNTGIVAGPGEMSLRLPLAAPFGGVATARLLGARVDAERQPDGSIAGRLGGAFLATDVDLLLPPLIAIGLNEVVERDCPAGPGSCDPGSGGERMLSLVDADQNGFITDDEVRESLLFSTSLFVPDVDLLDAAGNYAQDGIEESLSWGMGFATTGAVFDAP